MDVEDDITNKQEDSQEETIVQSPAEDTARQGGWKPLEEWQGNAEDWVDAKTFNQRGEYMERIKSQSSLIKKIERKLNLQEQTIKDLAEHHRKVAQIEREKALSELKSLKRDALDIGDHDKVVEIDDKISDLKAVPIRAQEPEESQEVIHPDVQDWMDENPWYSEDPMLQGAANGLVADLIKKNPSLQGRAKEVLQMMTNQLKEEFPTKFGTKRAKMQVLDSSSMEGTPKPKNKHLAKHLNEEQSRIAKRFVEQGAVASVEEYAKQLAEIGELKGV